MHCLSPRIVPRYRKVKDATLGKSVAVPADGPDSYLYVPCGKCMACKISRRKKWSSRCLFESFLHTHACMITLTYDDEHLPADGELCPRDLQLYLKRLRARLSPTKIRYFACGEYGSLTDRPHYHILCFGISGVLPEWSTAITESWSNGYVHIGDCGLNSIQYVTGYVIKKIAEESRHKTPTYTVMSRRPGIGHDFIRAFKCALRSDTYRQAIIDGLQPYIIHGGKRIHFDRYMLKLLLKECNIVLPDATIQKRMEHIIAIKQNYDEIVQGAQNIVAPHKNKIRGNL